jgi:hypothetical protein
MRIRLFTDCVTEFAALNLTKIHEYTRFLLLDCDQFSETGARKIMLTYNRSSIIKHEAHTSTMHQQVSSKRTMGSKVRKT